MNFVTKMKQKENIIWALGLSIVLCIVLGVFFDYYYDLNDDVLMKDILAGVYTGTPESRNIQMLFPVSFFISLFYRMVPALPWYGLFLCACHFGCLYLLTVRLLGFFHKAWTKAAAVFLEALLVLTLLLQELLFTQYTVTCTLLAATAAFLFYTCRSEERVKAFFTHNLGSILLVTLAYQIRSEMLLLVLPLICVTGLCRWAVEKPFFTRANAEKYFSVFGGILTGIALSQGVHMAAYGGEEWQQFNRFFDNRTQLYDFLAIPDYEGNEAFYESVGLSRSEQILLKNYNFGLDEEIDDELLLKICNYADGLRTKQASFIATLKKAVENYKYRTFHETDYPWNGFVIGMYLLVLFAALLNRRIRYLWELFCMGVVRTGLWMYILYRGRDPERITHSLYLMEFVILLAMLLREGREWQKKNAGKGAFCGRAPQACFMGLLALFGILCIGGSITRARSEYDRRTELNRNIEAFKDYAKENAENFYFVDVYSTVAYSEKMFAGVDNGAANYDIMGGWAVKSPLTEKKLAYFGIESMEEALLHMDNVYVLVRVKESEELPGLAEWLPDYYAGKGYEVSLLRTDSIIVDGKEVFYVYKIEKNEKVQVRKERV